jgi:hypothetical protein
VVEVPLIPATLKVPCPDAHCRSLTDTLLPFSLFAISPTSVRGATDMAGCDTGARGFVSVRLSAA